MKAVFAGQFHSSNSSTIGASDKRSFCHRKGNFNFPQHVAGFLKDFGDPQTHPETCSDVWYFFEDPTP